MSNVDVVLKEAVNIDGAVAALLVDYQSGMALGQAGDASALNLDVAAAGNTEVVRAKLKTIKSLGLTDQIDDILITLSSQYHIIRPLRTNPEVFIYYVLDVNKSNLALARIKAKDADKNMEL